MKYIWGIVLVFGLVMPCHAHDYATYSSYITRLLEAFSINPLDDEIDDLYKGIDACFKVDPDHQDYLKYKCIVESASVAWFDQRLKSKNSTLSTSEVDEERYHLNKYFDRAQNICPQDLFYTDVLIDSINVAQKNRALLIGLYLFKNGSVDFKALDRIKQELSEYQISDSIVSVVKKIHHKHLTLAEKRN